MGRYSSSPEQKEAYIRQMGFTAGQTSKRYFSPTTLYAVVLSIQFVLLFTLILPKASGILLLAYLFIIASMLLRWRVQLSPRYMLLDCGIICIASFLKPDISGFLSIYVFYFAWHNKLLFALLPVSLSFYLLKDFFRILPLQAALLGFFLYQWKKEITALYEENDRLRQKLYRMEQTELQLLSDYRNTERISQLKERQRLAEQLHDNLGHELTAAHLSVKALGTLLNLEEYPEAFIAKAYRVQQKAEERLLSALGQLKKAVHRLEPEGGNDIDAISELFKQFIYPVNYKQKGALSDLEPFHIQLLHGVVKEALTNIAKHALPSKIEANLEATDSIIKICIENDGIKNDIQNSQGSGLRYMRKRIEAINGSLSSGRMGDLFRIIIILPKDRSLHANLTC